MRPSLLSSPLSSLLAWGVPHSNLPLAGISGVSEADRCAAYDRSIGSCLRPEDRVSDIVRPPTLDAAIDELLKSIDVSDCDPEIMEATWREAALLSMRTRPSSSGLSPDQRVVLLKSGAFTPEQFAETEQRVARGELREEKNRTRLGTLARSYGEHTVAVRLDAELNELRKRQRAGALYAFDASGVTVYPKWQFTDQTDDGLLPHLAQVVALHRRLASRER